MLLKANEAAEEAARHAVRKREEEVTAKEGEVNRRLIELDKKLAKSKDLEVGFRPFGWRECASIFEGYAGQE